MTREERELALYCLKASSDYHSEVCEECINYPNCDHTIQDDVTETIIKALEQEPCEDAISRQAVIDALNKTSGIRGDALKALYELPPVKPQEPKWIPVSERLPEIQQDVLLSLRSLDVRVGFRSETEPYFYCNGNYIESQNVLAWMPLPAPYKAESEES